MCSATQPSELALAGQTVILIGGSAGIGLETARCARAQGADVVLTGRNRDRLTEAARDVGAQRTEAFDATDDDDPRVDAVKAKYKVVGLPTIVVLDEAGKERARFVEYISAAVLRTRLEAAARP